MVVATGLKNMGEDVAILFDQEALLAVAQNSKEWAPLMQPHATALSEAFHKLGFPPDVSGYLKMAVTAGVPLYSCPGWAAIIGEVAKLPPEVQVIPTREDFIRLYADAKKVIGGP